ncbi:MAG: RDD family protein [Planctomycetes bacterium]|nr:RDD family protein [Planctomycetota bacterium]
MVIIGLIGSLLRAEGLVDGAVFIVYQGLLVGLWNGQTLGKRACGIKVIGADGRPCTVGRAFGRAFARIISMLTLMIGFVMAAFDLQKRALHDRIAGTLHVYALE